MEQHPFTPPSPPRDSAPAPLATDRSRWTPARQRIFLAALLETGSVTRAAKAAGMNRSSAQRLRRRLGGTQFDRPWDQVLAAYAAGLADPFGDRAPSPPSRDRRVPAAPPGPR